MKARLPSYNTENLRLTGRHGRARPEDLDMKVECVSPSFLVKKSEHDFQLVTAFNTIGNYTKPSPSHTITTDDMFSLLAQHKYIIKTDITKQFFQPSLVGVIIPFKSIWVYTGAAMGN